MQDLCNTLERDGLLDHDINLVKSVLKEKEKGNSPPDNLRNVTYVSRESDSDSDSKLLRNTLEGRQSFQTCNENQLQFPITTTYSESTLKYTNTVACAMYNFF